MGLFKIREIIQVSRASFQHNPIYMGIFNEIKWNNLVFGEQKALFYHKMRQLV
jgi:hypothetical protein